MRSGDGEVWRYRGSELWELWRNSRNDGVGEGNVVWIKVCCGIRWFVMLWLEVATGTPSCDILAAANRLFRGTVHGTTFLRA